MEDQVFHLDKKPWEPSNHGDIGRCKILVGSNLTQKSSLKLMQLESKETFNSHEHSFLQLMYFTKGSGELIVDSNHFNIEPGLTAIVLPNQCHTVSNTGDTPMDIMVFETYELVEDESPFLDF
ncbi:MAG: cupin domain-containing protein [Candidatus Kariarchaeaceae archaeon]|jgi:quercetin dioxygenase-like cupin family protein